jgi:hypothetical protein
MERGPYFGSMDGAPSASIDEILEALSSDDFAERTQAAVRLNAMCKDGVPLEVGLTLIEAASRDFPSAFAGDDIAGKMLLSVVGSNPRPEYAAPLVALVPRLKPQSRPSAVRLLGQIGTVEAIRGMLDALERDLAAGEFPMDTFLNMSPLYWLIRNPAHPDLVFPRLFDLRSYETLTSQADGVVVEYLAHGLLDDEVFDGRPEVLHAVFKRLRALKQKARRARRAGGSTSRPWWRRPGYQNTRFSATNLLRGLGYLRRSEATVEQRKWSEIDDPLVQCELLAARLRRGEEVAPEELDMVAGDFEARPVLYERLSELGRTTLFPAQWATQDAFAEADMVRWLSFATELGEPPDRIELMERLEATSNDERAVFFVFRFAAKDGDWLAGVSGPFRVNDEPSFKSLGYTFSAFEPYESRTPREHVTHVIRLVRREVDPDEAT